VSSAISPRIAFFDKEKPRQALVFALVETISSDLVEKTHVRDKTTKHDARKPIVFKTIRGQLSFEN
jgi:hypothetical protein